MTVAVNVEGAGGGVHGEHVGDGNDDTLGIGVIEE